MTDRLLTTALNRYRAQMRAVEIALAAALIKQLSRTRSRVAIAIENETKPDALAESVQEALLTLIRQLLPGILAAQANAARLGATHAKGLALVSGLMAGMQPEAIAARWTAPTMAQAAETINSMRGGVSVAQWLLSIPADVLLKIRQLI